MTVLVLLASFLMGLAVFWAITGDKIKLQSRSVRLSDESFDTGKGPGKSSRDMLITLAGGLGLGAVAYAVTGTWFFTVLGLCCGVFVLKWWKKKQEEDRMELLKTQFVDVLGQLESALYGGMNPYQALEDAIPNMPRPARDVFYEVLKRVRTGDTLAKAVDDVRKETGWEDLRALSVALSLYNRVGGDLGEICRHTMDQYEDKESFRSIVSAAVAQNMMTMKVLTALPFIFVGMARLMAPGFTEPLFGNTTGWMVFTAATAWIALGNILTRSMIKKALGQGV